MELDVNINNEEQNNFYYETLGSYNGIRNRIIDLLKECRPYTKNDDGLYVQINSDDLDDYLKEAFVFEFSKDNNYVTVSLIQDSDTEKLFLQTYPTYLIYANKPARDRYTQSLLVDLIKKELKQELSEEIKEQKIKETNKRRLPHLSVQMKNAVEDLNENFSKHFTSRHYKKTTDMYSFVYNEEDNTIRVNDFRGEKGEYILFKYSEEKAKFLRYPNRTEYSGAIKFCNKVKKHIRSTGVSIDHICNNSFHKV